MKVSYKGMREMAKHEGKSKQEGRPKHILIVDDEETVGIGMSEMLKDAGFSATYVTDGEEAIKRVAENPVSLVFMDMMMPRMNGLETYRELRKIRPDVKVVLFTGYYRDVDRAIYEGVKEGMIDVYIRKPFFAEEIVETAKRFTGAGLEKKENNGQMSG